MFLPFIFLMAFVITSSVDALIRTLLKKVLILQPNLSLTLLLNSRYKVMFFNVFKPLFFNLLFNDSTALSEKHVRFFPSLSTYSENQEWNVVGFFVRQALSVLSQWLLTIFYKIHPYSNKEKNHL